MSDMKLVNVGVRYSNYTLAVTYFIKNIALYE